MQSNSRLTKGKLIVFEGPDGVGKSTLAKMVRDILEKDGQECRYVAFPGREPGTLGKHVYDLHHNMVQFNIEKINPLSLQMMHVAAHIDAIEGNISAELDAGRWIILDRFWWSTLIYGLAAGINRHALESLINIEKSYWQKRQPSVAFLIQTEKPLRDDEPLDKWKTLSINYYEHAVKQRSYHPVHIVKNDKSIEEAASRIISIISESVDVSIPNSNVPKSQSYVISTKKIQLSFDHLNKPVENSVRYVPVNISRIAPAKPTEVYDTCWKFAAERQAIFFRRLFGSTPPFTDDPILGTFKFTNAYRASDRISQYLIRNVIYTGDQSPEEVFFRIMLFKIFNTIDTWELLKSKLTSISYSDFSFEKYDRVLSEAMVSGKAIFSSAYIMPSGGSSFGFQRKHRNYLTLLEQMIKDEVPQRISQMRLMRDVFEIIRSYPMMGDFLAYQYTIDINYSNLTNFSEMEFVVPGPGARDGIRKCFSDLGGLNESDIIRVMAEQQENEFNRLGINFQSLWGRPLQLIDCQNLFCEVDKYARIAHPHIEGISGRQRIKQRYHWVGRTVECWYPPKWGINAAIRQLLNRG